VTSAFEDWCLKLLCRANIKHKVQIRRDIFKRLADDLQSGEWDRKYGRYRSEPMFTCALTLVISNT
jgi:hypothetical protein